MGTPRDFELDPIDPQSRPRPVPPRYLKRKIYSNPKVFKVIDKHAVDEARTNYRNFRDLIWNLICKKEYTQLEKCRSIFRWMTTKNMYTIMFDSELPGSPEQTLSGFKDGKVTYARIFEVLCQYAGLHCVTISGWAKGVDYRPGQPITQTAINHSWNAVHLDGNWQLVDTHWATRYLQNERNAPENLVYEYDDFYFIPEPGHLVYSHCPEEPAWQLLVPAIARAEYEDFPLVKSFFFSVGMEFLQQNEGVIYTKKGLYTITLGFAKPAAFTFKLAYGEKMAEAIQGINLKRYVIQETTENRVTFYFRAPREGNYYLTLFAQTVGEKIKVENIFKAACEYKLVADEAAGEIRPYPQCNDSNWGPGAPVRQYGLMPSHNAAILSAPKGRAEISFRRTRDVRLFARLVRDGYSEDTLEDAVDVKEQDDMIFVNVNLPNRGEYGLEIYANEPAKEGDTFTHMCQYLVSYIERDLGAQYGQVFDRLDLGYSMQAQPELWQGGAGGHYGSMQRGESRNAPGGGGPGGQGPGGQGPNGQQYGSQGSLTGAQYGGPGQGGPQQYDRTYGAGPGGAVPGGQYQNMPGQYATMPARTAQRGDKGYGDTPAEIGTLSAQADQAGMYASLPRGGSGGASVVGYGSQPASAAPEKYGISGVQHGAEPSQLGTYRPDQKNFVPGAYGAQQGAGGQYPGGKQVYEGSSADWDGNTYRERAYREETEATNDGTTRAYSTSSQGDRPLSTASTTSSHSHSSATGEDGDRDKDMTSRMESVTIGGKKQPPPTFAKPRGPGTAPRPGQGGPGQRGGPGGDDLPPPPPELMDQSYTQQARQPGSEDLPPPPPDVYGGFETGAAVRKQDAGSAADLYPSGPCTISHRTIVNLGQIGRKPTPDSFQTGQEQDRPGEGQYPLQGQPGQGQYPLQGQPGQGQPDQGQYPLQGQPGQGPPGQGQPDQGQYPPGQYPLQGQPGQSQPGQSQPDQGQYPPGQYPLQGQPGQGPPGQGPPGQGQPDQGQYPLRGQLPSGPCRGAETTQIYASEPFSAANQGFIPVRKGSLDNLDRDSPGSRGSPVTIGRAGGVPPPPPKPARLFTTGPPPASDTAVQEPRRNFQRPADKPPQPPVEIVYVSADSVKKNQEDQNRNQPKPIEVVYAQSSSPRNLRKNAASPKTLPKPDISKLRQTDGTLRKGSLDTTSSQSSLSSSQGDLRGSKKSLNESSGAAPTTPGGPDDAREKRGSRTSLEETTEKRLPPPTLPKSTSATDRLHAVPISSTSSSSPTSPDISRGSGSRSPSAELKDTEGLTGIKKGDPRFDVLAGSRAPSGAPLGGPAGGWTNPKDAPRPEDEEDFPPPPPLPSSGPPGSSAPPPPPSPASTNQSERNIPVQRENVNASQQGYPTSTYQRQYPFGGNRAGNQQPGEPQQQQQTAMFQHPIPEPDKEYEPHDNKVYKSSLTVTPPSSFRPVPIEERGPAPEPQPSTETAAAKPFKDTGVFEDVDTHAVEVSKMETKSFRDLVWMLIYARDITNELEKARAIFLWLCSKDLAKLDFDSVEKDSPEEILMSLKNGQTTYAVVYETLCSYAGLHCKTLSGYAKGAEYKPGMKFKGEQGQHSWNAVLVDGSWRLVDCHWAARRLVGKKVTVENIRYELDEYYFMPDPHQLIFTHFPDEANWQLLERSISLGDFENLVPVKSAFFKYGLQIMSHKEAVITTQREVTIRIGCPPLRAGNLAFTFTLAYNESGKEEFRGVKLNRFGMQEMVDNVAFLTIRPPERASYRLIIYAKDLSQDTKEGVYGGVCEYEVVCGTSPPAPQPFPPCVHTSWGPGDSAYKYDLTPMQKGAIFSTVNGQAEVRFQISKMLRFTAKLKTNEKDEKVLAGYIMYRVVENQAIFTINAPAKGEYGLEIYANDPEKDGNALFHAYQYLIICTDATGPVEPLPALPPGYLGAQPDFTRVGLSTASHQDPYIQLEGSDLEMSFQMSQPLRMTSQLVYVSKGQVEDLSDYVLQQGRKSEISFQLKLPKIGLYKYQIYALPYSDSSENLPGVYNYLINCHQAGITLAFPKQYGQWKEGCYLHYPQEGTIARSVGNEMPFRVSVPKANSVAVVLGEEWTQLDQKEGPDGAWEGTIPLGPHWGKESKMALCANYGSVKSSYSTLLEYSI